jgi:arylsulfatase A-like enzyme
MGVREVNVILVILDSLRKDHIGVYGNDRIQTPNLDALAKESLRFSRAYPESLPTLCARRAIHTGMRTWPFRNFVRLPGETFQPAGWQPIPEQQTGSGCSSGFVARRGTASAPNWAFPRSR